MENNRPEELLEDLAKMSDQELLQFLSDTGELERIAELVNDFIETMDKVIEERPNSMDVLLPFYRLEDLDENSDFVRFAWNLTPDTVAAVTGGRVKYTRKRKNRIKGAIELLHDITIGEACELVRLTLFTGGVDIKTPPSNARELYLEAVEEIDARYSGRAPEPKRKKASEAIVLAHTGPLLPIGSGPALDEIMRMLASRGDPTRSVAKRGGRVMDLRNIRTVEVEGKNSKVKIEVSDIDKLEGSNAGTKKMFVYLLETISSQAFHYGTLHKDYITFSINDLVQRGLYSTYQSAARGFKEAMKALTSFKVQGSITKGKNNTIVQSAIAVLFTGGEQKNGVCTVYLNDRIDWGFAIPFQMGLPTYYYKLKNKPSDLLYLIFFLARQNAEEIKSSGSFTISTRVIQDRLNLPSEKDTHDARRDIIDVIDSAIQAIEEENENPNFTMTMELLPGHGDITDCSVFDYLEYGRLRIAFKQEYASQFFEIAEKTKERKKKAAELNEAQKRKTLHDK